MALSHQIETADRPAIADKGQASFLDDSVIPGSLHACAIPSDDLGDTLRYIHRNAVDDSDWIFLLASILGEG